MGICDQRSVIVTGAGRGLGRAHAVALAAAGASVVVNDLGVAQDGSDPSDTPAQQVVDEITANGGVAVASTHDVADWDSAGEMVQLALESFGRLDAVVNNAGIVRDRMFVNSEESEWEAVLRVHVMGHAAPARHAAAHWRKLSKAGEAVDARIINTSSGAGLMGSIAQAAYSAAKGAIASMTLVQAAELGRIGVTANALAPAARTRMTEEAFADMMAEVDEDSFDAMDPANVSPLVVWLASPASAGVTGRVFEVEGGIVGIAEGYRHGPRVDKGARWEPEELTEVVGALLDEAAEPTPVYGAG
ncbi:MAG: SDR family oxidoreductase [Microthrixaceae bacterium]|nr:SDR family NAD(P)-dependent oxidoreductase [Microthrixaceae bacterium]MCO5316852.1 SDR family oxidoreductase [Microthrixaceae bacterium]